MKAKKIIATLLAGLMIASSLPLSAFADGAAAAGTKLSVSTHQDYESADIFATDDDATDRVLTLKENATVGFTLDNDHNTIGNYVWVKADIATTAQYADLTNDTQVTLSDVSYANGEQTTDNTKTLTYGEFSNNGIDLNYYYNALIELPDIVAGQVSFSVKYGSHEPEVFTIKIPETVKLGTEGGFPLTILTDSTLAAADHESYNSNGLITVNDRTATVTTTADKKVPYCTTGVPEAGNYVWVKVNLVKPSDISYNENVTLSNVSIANGETVSGNTKTLKYGELTSNGADMTYYYNCRITEDEARDGATKTFSIQYGTQYRDTFKIEIPANTQLAAAPSTEPSAKTITDDMVTLSRTSFTYNPGVTQKPTVTVKDGETTLTENTHYTLTWSSDDSIGVRSYTVTVNGIGDYTGSVQKTYEITSLVITDAMVTLDNTTLTYNGNEQKPSVTVSPFAGTTLNTNAHYDITWPADCTNVGEKTITIKGKDYISGTVTKTYNITKATLAANDYTPPTAKSGLTAGASAQALINAGSINVTTTGTATAPEMQYKVGNDGVYSTTVPTATSAGTYTVYWKIVGGTNYVNVNEQSIPVTIGEGSSTTPITYDAPTISGTTPFDGSTTVTITKTGNTVSDESAKIFYTTDGSTPDCESTEYTAPFTVSETCTVKAIVHSFTSTAYDSSVVEKTFTKNALPSATTDISTGYTATVDPNADLVYDGTAKEPAIIVTKTADGTTLTQGTDYTVSYNLNTDSGNARYTVSGTGNYRGTISSDNTFTISKRPITVTTLDQTITYGDSVDNTKYEITSGSLANGHTITATLVDRSSGKVGFDTVVIKDAQNIDVTANYNITGNETGKLTVNPATTSATIAPSDYYVDENNDYTSTDLLTPTDKNTVTFKSGAVIPYCKPTDGGSWAAGNYVWVKISLPTGLDLTNGIKVNDETITYAELDDIGNTGSKNTLVLNTKIEKSHITAGKKELVVKWNSDYQDTFTIVIPKGTKYEDSEGNTVGGSTNNGTTTPSTPSTPTDPTKPTVTTKTDAAGNTTTTTTWSDGKKSEVTVAANGDVTATVTAADGSVIAEIDLPSTPETEKTFNDVKDGDWYKEAVETAAGLGILNGTSEKNFSPKVDMTRGMIVKALHNLCGGSTYGVGETTFKDTTGQYYNDPAEWAAKLGITNGSGNSDTFKPNDSVTREQLVTMLYRFAKAIGLDTSKTTSLDSFSDSEKVSDYAEEAMAWAVANGIINGRPSANGGEALSAKGTANRAEVAAILARFVVLFK